MHAENLEFIDLLKRSGWKPAEAARRLELKPASVSRYRSGKDKPTKQTLRLFRLLLCDQSDAGALAGSSRHSHAESDLWKQRARQAQSELEGLRRGLRSLLARPSSKITAEAEAIEAAARARLASEPVKSKTRIIRVLLLVPFSACNNLVTVV